MKKNTKVACPSSNKKQSKQSVRIKSAVKVGKKEGFVSFHDAVKNGMI